MVATVSLFFIIGTFVVPVISRPQADPRAAAKPSFPEEPPQELKKVLPKEKYEELAAIHKDKSLTPQQKFTKIGAVMDSLPDDVWAKLPPPPGFEKLPAHVQAKLKEIHNQRGSHAERQGKYKKFIDSLPEEHRRLLRPPVPKA